MIPVKKMKVELLPGARRGAAVIPSSKSQAHRALICAALSDCENVIKINGVSDDIRATAGCLAALACETGRENGGFSVGAFAKKRGDMILPCGESGTTLRLLLPVAGALGLSATFVMKGRLPERPLEPLGSLLESKGMRIEKRGDKLFCSGSLAPGDYEIAGDVSSQYISGLLLALPLLSGDSTLTVTGAVESAGYISLTEQALALSGIAFKKEGRRYIIKGGQSYRFPAEYTVPADWSGAAAFACMGALSEGGITLSGPRGDSLQPDKKIIDILRLMGAQITEKDGRLTVKAGALRGTEQNVSDTPDLVPVLAALAAVADGKTVISGAARLRLKESDRLSAAADMLTALGADIRETDDGLVINGRPRLSGGVADPSRDHRMAMAAAVAACRCEKAVTVINAECVDKSYPGFWEDLSGLEVEK